MQSKNIVNAMSVDVEDYFQVSAFEENISRTDWPRYECRVEANTYRILDLFSEHNCKATFFTLGWVAERYPGIVRRIIDEGHELASHGYEHIRVTQQDSKQFREDVLRTKGILEDLGGARIRGYRAASYSIGRDNLWALDVLQETGHEYSSSIYPIRHDLYGMPEAERFAYHVNDLDILEIPVTTVELRGKKFPCGGGGYFRLLPYRLSKWAMDRVNRVDGKPCNFYFHPWEIDPDQPRQRDIGLKTRFRHYLNLRRVESRLKSLLCDFKWSRMDDVYLESTSEDRNGTVTGQAKKITKQSARNGRKT